MDKERAHIMGELEFETGNIEVRFEGKMIGHIVLVATIIKNENLTFEEYYVKYKGLY